MFVPRCGLADVINFFISRCSTGGFGGEDLGKLKAIILIPLEWPFGPFIAEIVKRFEKMNTPLEEICSLTDSLNVLSESQFGTEAKAELERICAEGQILHYLSQARQKDEILFASLLLVFLEQQLNGNIRSHRGDSATGLQYFSECLRTPSETFYAKVVVAAATELCNSGRLNKFVELPKQNPKTKKFVLAVLNNILTSPLNAEIINGELFLDHFQLFQECLPNIALLPSLLNDGLKPLLIQKEFKIEWSPIYLVALNDITPRNNLELEERCGLIRN
jgi:hypothetical protein